HESASTKFATKAAISNCQQLTNFVCDAPVAHKGFTHEDCPHSVLSELLYFSTGLNPAFGDEQLLMRGRRALQPLGDSLCRRDVNFKRFQVAVIHSDESRACIE